MSKDETGDARDAIRAEERKRIARDVHDELGGDLAAIKMALAVLGRRLPQDEGLREQLAYVDKLVDGAIDAMHRVADEWQHATCETFRQYAGQHIAAFSRQSGIACHQALDDAPPDLRSAQALSYMLRECLTNIARHAQATQVRVGLRVAEGKLVFEVEDDGIGLPGNRPSGRQGTGIRGMQERTRELGGDFSMRQLVPHGTLVMIELPLGNEPTDQH